MTPAILAAAAAPPALRVGDKRRGRAAGVLYEVRATRPGWVWVRPVGRPRDGQWWPVREVLRSTEEG